MINKLTEKIRKTHAPICVGLDPMLSYVPKQVQETAFKEYGETLEVPQKQSGSLIKQLLMRLMI